MQLPGTSLNPHGPVAFWGWSSGGQPSASAAELAPSYTAGVNLGRPARRYHPVAAVRRRPRNYTTQVELVGTLSDDGTGIFVRTLAGADLPGRRVGDTIPIGETAKRPPANIATEATHPSAIANS